MHCFGHKWLMVCGVLVLVGCHQNSHPSVNEPKTDTQAQKTIEPTTTEQTTQSLPIVIDWSVLDTGVAPIDPAEYVYPFAIDGEPVQNYAKEYNITPTQAQHSMMLAMAAPEPLGKVLDQIQGHYLGHTLTDGKAMSLVIYTTDQVTGGQYDYVIADKFGEGLLLPVVVTPKPKSAN